MTEFDDLLRQFEEPAALAGKDVPAEKPEVLVIDDDESIRRGLTRAFSHTYKITTAESAQEGVARLTPQTHCVILDVKMKGQNGFQAYPELKKKSPAVPIIFHTAFQSEHDLQEVINKYKPEGYVEKGRDITFLENLLQNAVHKYRLILENEEYKQDLEQKVEERTRELETTQAQLLQSAKMASVGELAAGIAHQINNPLALIESSHRALARFIDKEKQLRDKVESLGLTGEEQDFVKDVATVFDQIERTLQPQEEIEQESEKFASVLKNAKVRKAESLARKIVELQLPEQQQEYLVKLVMAGKGDVINFLNCMSGTRNHLKKIDLAIARIFENTNALKKFVHLDQDISTEADVHTGIEDTLKIMESSLKDVQVTKRYRDIPKIYCHPGMLNQVWQNIINNSVQAMAGEGSIHIETDLNDRDSIVVRFSDTGPGIPAEILPRIFEPYFTTKDQGEGTGLGLNMCYKIIQSHGGSIEVNSPTGKGASFEVVLPIRGDVHHDQ